MSKNCNIIMFILSKYECKKIYLQKHMQSLARDVPTGEA